MPLHQALFHWISSLPTVMPFPHSHPGAVCWLLQMRKRYQAGSRRRHARFHASVMLISNSGYELPSFVLVMTFGCPSSACMANAFGLFHPLKHLRTFLLTMVKTYGLWEWPPTLLHKPAKGRRRTTETKGHSIEFKGVMNVVFALTSSSIATLLNPLAKSRVESNLRQTVHQTALEFEVSGMHLSQCFNSACNSPCTYRGFHFSFRLALSRGVRVVTLTDDPLAKEFLNVLFGLLVLIRGYPLKGLICIVCGEFLVLHW